MKTFNIKQIVLPVLIATGALLSCQASLAADYDCYVNPNTPLVAGSIGLMKLSVTELEQGKYWGTPDPVQIDSPDLFKCDTAIPGRIIEPSDVFNKKATVHIPPSGAGGPVVVGGKTYYKLQATGNDFLDKNGYIALEVGETGGNVVPYTGGTIDLRTASTNTPPSLGLTIHSVQYLFTQPPTDVEMFQLHLTPTFDFEVSGDKVTGRMSRQYGQFTLTFALEPQAQQTCTVEANTVMMNPGDITKLTGGHPTATTQFDLVARCPPRPTQSTLSYIIMDDLIGNSYGVFSDWFTVFEATHGSQGGMAPNMGLYIEDPVIGRLVTGTKYDFGVLQPNVSIVRKTLTALYRPLRPTGVAPEPGAYYSRATVMVQYK